MRKRPTRGAAEVPGPGPVLLYDGACGLCDATVRFVVGRDRRRTLRFAPLDGTFAAGVHAEHPELAGVDSVVWYDPSAPEAGRVATHSEAMLRVARYLGGGWRALGLLRPVPRAVRDAAYRLVARHRHRIFRAPESCLVPPRGEEERFLA